MADAGQCFWPVAFADDVADSNVGFVGVVEEAELSLISCTQFRFVDRLAIQDQHQFVAFDLTGNALSQPREYRGGRHLGNDAL